MSRFLLTVLIINISCLFSASGVGQGNKSNISEVRYVGRIEPFRQATQLAPFNGKILKYIVAPGTSVKESEPILLLARISSGEEFGTFNLRANISGWVDRFFLDPGSEFKSGDPLTSLIDSNQYLVKVMVSDKDQSSFTVGEAIKVKTPILKEDLSGKVLRKSLTPIDKSGLFLVEFQLAKHDKIYLGQYVTIEKLPQNNGK